MTVKGGPIMLTHAKIHTLVSQRKMTPEHAADILVKQRSYRETVQSKSLFGKLGFLAIALVASFFGIRQDRG
jgi:hypothetical protein